MSSPKEKQRSELGSPDEENALPSRTERHGASSSQQYFPEDERSSMDWEGDHSDADFDLDAEIEAKLGRVEEKQPAADAATSPQEESGIDVAVSEGQGEEFFYPEGERPCEDWEEDDHSCTDFDLDAEIEARLGKAVEMEPTAPVAGLVVAAPPAGNAAEQEDECHYPEDIRPCLDWEDDHHDEIDPDAEIEAKLGQGGARASSEETPSSFSAESGNEGSGMHPDLAAALAATQAFAARGYVPAPPGQPPVAGPEASQGSGRGSEGEEAPDAPDSDEDAPLQPPASSAGNEAGSPGFEASGNGASASGAEAAVKADSPLREAPESDGGDSGEGSPPDKEDSGDGEDDEDGEEKAEDKPMTLRDHLRELRKRLLRAFLWMLAGFLLCYPFAEELFNYLMLPLIKVMPESSKLIFTNPPEAFFTFMKVAFVAGIFITSPMVFYQIWAFVAPGLYKEEKLYIVPVAIFSALFFICGGAFCYFIGFPFVFEFFMSYNKGLIQAMPSLKETLSFVLQLLLAFGLVFELPLFVFFLSRLGILTADMMRRFRRYAILLNVIVAAILTPPDVMSQMLMAGPLLVLYEISIFIAAIFGKKKPKPEPEEEDEDDDDEEDDESEEAPVAVSTVKQS